MLLTITIGYLRAVNGVETFYLKQVNQSIVPKCPWASSYLEVPTQSGTEKRLPALCLPYQPNISEPSIPSVQQRAAEAWLPGAAPTGPSLPPPCGTQLALKGSVPGVCLCGLEGHQGPQDALQPSSTPGTCPDASGACSVPGLASPWTHPKEPTQCRVHIPMVGLNQGVV